MWAEILFVTNWKRVKGHAKVWTYCRPGTCTIPSCQSRPGPVLPIKHSKLSVALLVLLKEWPHDLRQVILWPKRLLPWQNWHPAAQEWQQNACVYVLSVSQCHVCLSNCHNVSRLCLSVCTRPRHCHIVSAWLKRACMQRAMPQLSETEMGFDFHNPVASVHHSPLTRVLTEQECSVAPSNLSALSYCDKDFPIFTQLLLQLLFKSSQQGQCWI